MGERHLGTVSAPTRRQLLRGAGGAAVAALLAACSSSKSTSTTTSPAATASPSPAATGSSSRAASASPSGTGSGSPSGSASGSASGGPAMVVVIKDFAFHPPTFTVAAGAKVTVTNQDSTSHTLTSTTSGAFDTGTLAPGQSTSITAPAKAGAYPFRCTIHPNMTGTLTAS